MLDDKDTFFPSVAFQQILHFSEERLARDEAKRAKTGGHRARVHSFKTTSGRRFWQLTIDVLRIS